MSRSPKKKSLGFRVVDTRSREILSPVFPKREPAREIARDLYVTRGVSAGVSQVFDWDETCGTCGALHVRAPQATSCPGCGNVA